MDARRARRRVPRRAYGQRRVRPAFRGDPGRDDPRLRGAAGEIGRRGRPPAVPLGLRAGAPPERLGRRLERVRGVPSRGRRRRRRLRPLSRRAGALGAPPAAQRHRHRRPADAEPGGARRPLAVPRRASTGSRTVRVERGRWSSHCRGCSGTAARRSGRRAATPSGSGSSTCGGRSRREPTSVTAAS